MSTPQDKMTDSTPALRISQLDAAELDSQLFDLFLGQLNDVFKYFKPGLLGRYNPEVKAALRLLLWKFTLYQKGATVGQQLLDLKYKNVAATSSQSPWISESQRKYLALATILLPWLQERSPEVTGKIRHTPYGEKLLWCLQWIEKCLHLAQLLNFLLFLRSGVHQHLVERLLRIQMVFPKPQAARQVGFDVMDRELLWHGFAEFLFFVLPLINFTKIKNFVSRKLRPSSSFSIDHQRSAATYQECVICGEWPYSPYEMGCVHVFCYVCLRSNFLADGDYRCPLCDQKCESLGEMRPVQISLA